MQAGEPVTVVGGQVELTHAVGAQLGQQPAQGQQGDEQARGGDGPPEPRLVGGEVAYALWYQRVLLVTEGAETVGQPQSAGSEQEDAEHILGHIEKAGRKGHAIAADITDADRCRALVAEAVGVLGGLDILVNNAGKQVAVAQIADLSDEQFELTFRTNVFANFWITKAALGHMSAGASIINTASLEAYKPSPERLDYAATKAAINNFSKGLSQQVASRGIRVNVVAPGPVWTALQVSGGVSDEQMKAFDDENTYKRSGQPAEIAPAYVFLASAESSYVSGETLNVNGGMVTP